MTGGPSPPAVTPARQPTAAVYQCRNVDVDLESSHGRRRILDDVTFDLLDTEFVSIMGRSGSGKTTLLRVLGGLL